MPEIQIDMNTVRAEYEALPKQFSTLLLATATFEGTPNASYAPYIRHDGDFYIYVSELAAHTGNLKRSHQASVLFIEEESGCKNPFARRRVTFQCEANEVERDSALFLMIMDQFSATFGTLVNMLRGMQDFHLYRLHPLRATYVGGFARAFVFEGNDLDTLRHLNDTGHRGPAMQTDLATAEQTA
jgi:putative heme iron utilization protein